MDAKPELVWDKTHSACDRFGSFAQHPYPHNFYPNLCTEWVLVMRKPELRAARSIDAQVREASRLPLTRLATSEISNDVWHIAVVRHGEVEHCALFRKTWWPGWSCATRTRVSWCSIRSWAAG